MSRWRSPWVELDGNGLLPADGADFPRLVLARPAPEVYPRSGPEAFRRFLEAHLPPGMTLPVLFRDDGLLEPTVLPDGLRTKSFLGDLRELERRLADEPTAPVPAPEDAARAAAVANERVTGRRLAALYFVLAGSERHVDRANAAALLAYWFARLSNEPQVRDAAKRIVDRLRRFRAGTCPVLAINILFARRRKPTCRIRDAYIRSAAFALQDAGMPISPGWSGNDGATLIAAAFGVSVEVVERVGVKYRHDNDYKESPPEASGK